MSRPTPRLGEILQVLQAGPLRSQHLWQLAVIGGALMGPRPRSSCAGPLAQPRVLADPAPGAFIAGRRSLTPSGA